MDKEHSFSRYPGVTICESAAEAAAKAMAYRGGMVLPVHAYTQGGRMFLSTVLTVRELLSAAKINEPEKGEKRDITGKDFLNRKRDSTHVGKIVTYLVENEQWILGSVILNSLKPLNTFLHGEGSVVEGYVVLPPESGTFTIDGQHREEGLKQAVLLKPELAQDSLQVIISQEQDVDQVRDDFACLGQTKPIDKSTLVIYQSSDAHVSLVKEIIDQAKIFQGRIQPEGSSISKKNNYLLFTASSLAIAVAELVYGGSDKTTKTKGVNLLKDEAFRVHAIKKAVMFYDKYAAYSPDWTPLLQDKSITQKTVAISLLRDKRLDFRNTGLQIVSRVGYHILFNEDSQLSEEVRDIAIKALAHVDFRLDNDQSRKFWEDCGVVTQTGIGTQRQVIEQGVKAVWDKVLQSMKYEAV